MTQWDGQATLEELMKTGEQKNPEAGLLLAESFVKKYYLDNIDSYNVSNLPRSVKEQSTEDCVRFYQLTEVVLNKNEKVLERLNNVYSAMHSLELSVIMLLTSTKTGVEFYLGVRTPDGCEMNRQITEAFERTFYGNFPGSKLKAVEGQGKVDALLGRIMPEDGSNAVTALTSVPALKDEDAENEKFTQGIEKVIDTMQGTEYAILIISDPVNKDQIAWTKQGYEELYSELYPLSQTELSIGKSDAKSMSVSEMDGVTETIGTSVSKTQSFGKGTSSARSESRTNTLGLSMGAFGSQGNSHATGKTKTKSGTAGPEWLKLGYSSAKSVIDTISATLGVNGGANISTAHTTGYTDTTSENWQKSYQTGKQESTSSTHQNGTQQGTTASDSTTATVRYANKSIQVMLDLIEEQLKRIKDCENYGVWSSAAYFLSPSRENSVVAASAYKGIINGENTSLESSSMNTWFRDDNVSKINDYLRRLRHPRFYDPEYLSNFSAMTDVGLTTMVNTKELSIQCNVPYRSVAGVTVREMAEFGRNLPRMAEPEQELLHLGKIYHMGRPEPSSEVRLSRNAMASHTFVTGSTGTGKSNAVYNLLDDITKDGRAAFLVIEPAKGEYKHIFGSRAAVYGTNPALTPLLKINPFAFPKEIHVLEHIDRLTEIFNACWPMYAAMPAVLKDAIERIYQKAGWDLRRSENAKNVYPTFYDLMDILPTVIEESGYSKDTKSDYIGALHTRVKSLTNGIYGSVLCAEDVMEDAELFDQNVIVDLSRVSSMETKALLMGILVTKLQEYRMCSGVMNSPLRHVTVLEEAHNLLRRTSFEQAQEGANLQGKSVEMLANAIAELRTYGEGFIIADQAPGLLDASVIRNTNTKIILRLPDEEDRVLVGRSAGLKEDQISELAKLPLGVAAVYQNDWPEAVLCQMEKYPTPAAMYCKPTQSGRTVDTGFVFRQLASGNTVILRDSNEIEQLKEWLKRREAILGADGCQTIQKVFEDQKVEKAELEKVVEKFFGGLRYATIYARAEASGAKPREAVLNRLESQYDMERRTAEWLLNNLMTMFVNNYRELKIDISEEKIGELKKNFLKHGGKLL